MRNDSFRRIEVGQKTILLSPEQFFSLEEIFLSPKTINPQPQRHWREGVREGGGGTRKLAVQGGPLGRQTQQNFLFPFI